MISIDDVSRKDKLKYINFEETDNYEDNLTRLLKKYGVRYPNDFTVFTIFLPNGEPREISGYFYLDDNNVEQFKLHKKAEYYNEMVDAVFYCCLRYN